MLVTLSSSHEGFTTLPGAVGVFPPYPTLKGSRLSERKEGSPLLPRILGLSTPSRGQPPAPPRPLLV